MLDSAFKQKIQALINRTETQARDIFDLKWLLDYGASTNLLDYTEKDLQTALMNLLSINFADFKGQVVAYLMDEYRQFYDSQKIWEEIQQQVGKVLQRKSNAAN